MYLGRANLELILAWCEHEKVSLTCQAQMNYPALKLKSSDLEVMKLELLIQKLSLIFNKLNILFDFGLSLLCVQAQCESKFL